MEDIGVNEKIIQEYFHVTTSECKYRIKSDQEPSCVIFHLITR